MKLSHALMLSALAAAIAGCKQAPPITPQPVVTQPIQQSRPTPSPAPAASTPPPKPVAAHHKPKAAARQKCATGYDCTHVWSTYIP